MKKKKRAKLNPTAWIELICGLLFVCIGLLAIFYPLRQARLFFWCVFGVCAVSDAFLWLKAFHDRHSLGYLEAMLLFLFCAYLYSRRGTGWQMICILLSFYWSFTGLCFLVQFGLDLKNRAEDTWMNFAQSVLYLGLGIVSFINRTDNVTTIQLFLGLYFLIQGGQALLEVVFFSHPHSARWFDFRHWAALPVVLVSTMPAWIYGYILKKRLANNGDPIGFARSKPSTLKPNLRVFIHTGLDGEKMFGHMTFAFDGTMYSYGNYDKAKWKFARSVGPGIFFTVNADRYIYNSCIYEGSTLFEYDLYLTDEQMNRLKEALSKVIANTYPWQCPMQTALKAGENINIKEYETDYSNRLWYRTNAAYRKFKKGEYKTYWILGDNCSLFAASMLHKADPDIPLSHGISTPGEFFEYFEEAFRDPDSNVLARCYHTARFPATLPDIPPIDPAAPITDIAS